MHKERRSDLVRPIRTPLPSALGLLLSSCPIHSRRDSSFRSRSPSSYIGKRERCDRDVIGFGGGETPLTAVVGTGSSIRAVASCPSGHRPDDGVNENDLKQRGAIATLQPITLDVAPGVGSILPRSSKSRRICLSCSAPSPGHGAEPQLPRHSVGTFLRSFAGKVRL